MSDIQNLHHVFFTQFKHNKCSLKFPIFLSSDVKNKAVLCVEELLHLDPNHGDCIITFLQCDTSQLM